jgi:excisionase family DNA binding protein
MENDQKASGQGVARPSALALRGSEAASMLGISSRKLWALTNSGEIPAVRFGRSVRYRPVDLQEWLDRHLSSGPGGGR